MVNFDLISQNFNNIHFDNGCLYLQDNLYHVLEFLKHKPEFDFDMLICIIAVDYNDKIQLKYKLYSTNYNKFLDVAIDVYNNSAVSVMPLYKSAYFEECEIYDLFGITFENNTALKRLYMPKNWIGHPMLKSYIQNDERLAWND